MSEPQLYAALPDYEAIVEAINRRRGQVNVSVKTLALAASLQPGFVGSALGPSRTRRLGYLSLPMLLAPLGLRLGLIEAPELAARYVNEMEKSNSNQARSNNHASPVSKRVVDRALRHLARQSWAEIIAAVGQAKAAVAEQVAKGAVKTNGHPPASSARQQNGTAAYDAPISDQLEQIADTSGIHVSRTGGERRGRKRRQVSAPFPPVDPKTLLRRTQNGYVTKHAKAAAAAAAR